MNRIIRANLRGAKSALLTMFAIIIVATPLLMSGVWLLSLAGTSPVGVWHKASAAVRSLNASKTSQAYPDNSEFAAQLLLRPQGGR